MSKTIALRLPPASAQKMGLNPAPEGIYTFSWIELAFRLTQATGNQGFADVIGCGAGLPAIGTLWRLFVWL